MSHMKMLGDSLFFVKNTRDIVRFDMRTKSSFILGSTRDAAIALYATRNVIREVDAGEEEKLGVGIGAAAEIEDEEEARSGFMVCCLDESENVYVVRGRPGEKKT